MIEFNVKRTHNFENIIKHLAEAANDGVKNAVDNTQEEAVKQKHNMTREHGTLDKNIKTEIKNIESNITEGRVYTDDSALVFMEFGTGIKKDDDFPHIGKTKTFRQSGRRYWLVPAEKVTRPIGKLVVIDGKSFYMAFTQAAKPFMRTTAVTRREGTKDDIKQSIIKLFKKGNL